MDLMYILGENRSAGVNRSQLDHIPSYLESDRTSAIVYLFLGNLIMAVGCVGNALVIGAVFVSKQLRNVGNVFIVNLAIADLCVTGFVDPFTFLGVVEGESYFLDKWALCEAVASVCLTSCFCSLLSIGSISLNRYIHICHNQHYTRIYTLRNSILMCVGLWIFSFFCEFPNFVGWGDHVFDQKTQGCIYDRVADYSYTLFFAVGGIMSPIALIAFLYLKIFLHVRASKLKVASRDRTQGGGRDSRESVRLARTLFMIFAVFASCWLPYAFIVILDFEDQLSPDIHTYSVLIAHINSGVNSIIYGVTNIHFRRAYAKLLCLEKCAWYKRQMQAAKGDETTTNATQMT